VSRKKSFDEQATLRNIGQLFWRNGYMATDLDRVCAHVSLSKPSIYNAYGDKRALFRKVIDWYAEEVVASGRACLTQQAPVAEEIAAMLCKVLLAPDKKVVSRGCLLATTMLELQYSEPELFTYVQSHFDQVVDDIQGYMLTAHELGRLKADTDPNALGDYVLTLLLGLRMQTRVRGRKVDLQNLIGLAMGPIETSEARRAKRRTA